MKVAKGCKDGQVRNEVNLATHVNGDKIGSKLVYYYYVMGPQLLPLLQPVMTLTLPLSALFCPSILGPC